MSNEKNNISVFAPTTDKGELFTDAKRAVKKLKEIYDTNTAYIEHLYRDWETDRKSVV